MAGEAAETPSVDVVAVVVERYRHVQRVAGHHDVGGPRVEADAVEINTHETASARPHLRLPYRVESRRTLEMS